MAQAVGVTWCHKLGDQDLEEEPGAGLRWQCVVQASSWTSCLKRHWAPPGSGQKAGVFLRQGGRQNWASKMPMKEAGGCVAE